MPSPYEYQDYREYLREEVIARKELDSSINFQNMAAAVRVQKPFFSKVVNGHNHLTPDQLYLACKYFRLSESETKYMELTRDLQTSSLKARKDELQRRVEVLQKKYLETDEHLTTTRLDRSTDGGINEYYLDPLYQLVHVAMSIPRYSKDLKLLANDLYIPVDRILAAVKRLEELGVLKIEGSSIKVVAHNLHLPRTSKEYLAWNSQLRLAGLHRSQNLSAEDAYGFSVVFSSNEDTRRQIQDRFLKFVNGAQKLVTGTEEENLYQMNFDLFNWNSPVKK